MKKLNIQSQAGMVLIVSLIILVSLTILGVTSMLNSRTEVSMAGNLRKAGTAFNAAEAGLRAGEKFVNDSISTTIYNDPTIGLYPPLDNDPYYGPGPTWDAAQVAVIGLPDVAQDPRFIIHYLGDRSQNEVARINVGGYGSMQPGVVVANFRITAMGVGQTTNEVRFVQSHLGHAY